MSDGSSQKQNESWITQVLSWASGQPFNNVLLGAIFAAICWITHFGMTAAIPQHLKQIQDGYERIDNSHRGDRERTIEVYDKWLDRMERRGSIGYTQPRPELQEMLDEAKVVDAKGSQ